MAIKASTHGAQNVLKFVRIFPSVLVVTLAACVMTLHTSVQTTFQSASPPVTPKTSITILVLNGVNGRSVWREEPNVWIDDEPRLTHKTNLFGKTKIEVPASAKELAISPNWGHECRGGDNPQARTNIRYSIAEILSTGVVALNLCGKFTRKPQPGVLVFYERPSTWKELWNN